MAYVIRRGDGAFVAPSGSPASYVRALQHARVYETRAQAERDKCGNEVVVSIDEAMPHTGRML